jgi:hypothetical protein
MARNSFEQDEEVKAHGCLNHLADVASAFERAERLDCTRCHPGGTHAPIHDEAIESNQRERPDHSVRCGPLSHLMHVLGEGITPFLSRRIEWISV